jgi:vacuolar protein sorting-associated protein 51
MWCDMSSDAVEEEKNRLNIDHKNFQADTYVDSLLRERGMKDLLDEDSRLLHAKRQLDSDMQMLVYENYNKFISATDMIRKMKDNVESMEDEMNVCPSH